MVNVRLVVLAVCFMVSSHLDSSSARPQFSGNLFPASIGVKNPIGGVSLGVPSGFPFNFGWGQQQVPQQQVPQQQVPQQQVPQQQVPQQQAPQQQVLQQQPVPQQAPQQQYPQQQQPAPQQQVPQQQPTVTTNAPNSEGLDSRFDGESALPEEYPCQNVDTSTGAPNETGSDGDSVTEQPCLGIGGGNRINPKQAALLSLVG
ncbi:putative uncharacterized protein DDB_G0271606 [Anopheles maculipalpis]|uniref:putative uncharacterized protein DDB_G0271606 n=1 Tax=Anopheles maculipalpis TaxID=1496333 RepID=UPI002158A15E|nr:putative uncharacterized protein DDB_G0271606 [Anopheles maculipalpis]